MIFSIRNCVLHALEDGADDASDYSSLGCLNGAFFREILLDLVSEA